MNYATPSERQAAQTEFGWSQLSLDAKARVLFDVSNEMEAECLQRRPTAYVLENGVVSFDQKDENHGERPRRFPISDFIVERRCLLLDGWREREALARWMEKLGAYSGTNRTRLSQG